MRYKNKGPFGGFFSIFLLLFLCFALFLGCGSDSNNSSGNDVSDNGNTEPGPPVDANSSITVNPASIPADGESEAVVTVTLADEYEAPVSDGTEVLLAATSGTIVSENPAATSAGRVDFTVRAPNESGSASLYLPEYSDISGAELVLGSIGSGIPASIRIDSVYPYEIAVTGVGETDSAAVSLSVVDEAGNNIADSDYVLRVSFLARPGGGEYVSAGDGEGNADNDAIQIPFTNGNTSFNVHSWNLPGVVEVLVEVLDNGESLDPAIKTVIPQISIASGPPHIISINIPNLDAIVNLTNEPDGDIPSTPGFYSLRAGVSVLDKYGNAVPDGTVVNVGVMDSVISSGTCNIEEGSDILTDTGGGVDFIDDYVVRNNTERYIEPAYGHTEAADRLIIFDAKAQDKVRFVDALLSGTELYANKPYSSGGNNLEYAVGASLLGASIYGIDEDGNATKGTVRIKNGLGQIRFVYPANSDTIFIGYVDNDPRHSPEGSARVISVFSTSDNSATVVDEGSLGFASVAGWTLEAKPQEISATDDIQLEVVDGGDEIRLPFVEVAANVRITSRADNSDLDVTATNCITDITGTCTSTITISGGSIESGDSALITYSGGDAEDVEVQYTAP